MDDYIELKKELDCLKDEVSSLKIKVAQSEDRITTDLLDTLREEFSPQVPDKAPCRIHKSDVEVCDGLIPISQEWVDREGEYICVRCGNVYSQATRQSIRDCYSKGEPWRWEMLRVITPQ